MSASPSFSLHFEAAAVPEGVRAGVRLVVEAGRITHVESNVAPQAGDERCGFGVPGVASLHSHAFQRAMAGLAERRSGTARDDFWTWRDLMYRLALALEPDAIEAIASYLYMELLESGFTRVGEFHYLHHAPDGTPYDEVAETATRIAAAAETSGISLTLLPVLYSASDFGRAPPLPEQRRFVSDLQAYFRLLEASGAAIAPLEGAVLGCAPHSLRAVEAESLHALAAWATARACPIHIHIAEQEREVEACLAHTGSRPVEWLLAQGLVDARWCLVHATCTTAEEVQTLAASGACVGLCPTTEANLGDGIFDAGTYAQAGGIWGVGTDANAHPSLACELRGLEYSQRLLHRSRNVMAQSDESSAISLLRAAGEGGARALGAGTHGFRAGAWADAVSLSEAAPFWHAAGDARAADGWVFSRGDAAVESVWARGKRVVAHGRHFQRDALESRWQSTLASLVDVL